MDGIASAILACKIRVVDFYEHLFISQACSFVMRLYDYDYDALKSISRWALIFLLARMHARARWHLAGLLRDDCDKIGRIATIARLRILWFEGNFLAILNWIRTEFY